MANSISSSRSGIVGLVFAGLAIGLAPATVGQTWNETFNLFPSDPTQEGGYGGSVALEGDFGVIAAGRSGTTGDIGLGYVIDLTTGAELRTLLALDGATGDRFGSGGVDIDNGIVIIGAPEHDLPLEGGGAAYLFDLNSGAQLQKLQPASIEEFDSVGESVAIGGGYALASSTILWTTAYVEDEVHVFDVATGAELRTIRPTNIEQNAQFGQDIDVDGTTAMIGASSDDRLGLENTGSAFLYDIATGTQLFKLTAPDADTSEFQAFGIWVALDGDLAMAWAFPWFYVFDANTGDLLNRISAADVGVDRLGSTHDLIDDTLVTTAFDASDNVSAIFVDARTSMLIDQVIPSSIDNFDGFGTSIAANGDRAIIGAPGDSEIAFRSGSAYVFETGSLPPIELELTGTCPGPMSGVVTNATPGGSVYIIYGFGSTGTIGQAPCAGTQLDVGQPRLGFLLATADANGVATEGRNAPPLACGQVRVQAIDVETCRVSNVIEIQ